MTEKEKLGVRMPEEMVKSIDECVERGKHMSRSDYIRTAVRYYKERD